MARARGVGSWSALGIAALLVLLIWTTTAWQEGHLSVYPSAGSPMPEVDITRGGELEVKAPPGYRVHYTLNGSLPGPGSPVVHPGWRPVPDRPAGDRYAVRSTSPQWRHPIFLGPRAAVVRLRCCDADGRCGPVVTRTLLDPASGLPVVALTLPWEALFDPDSGIYVPGNAYLRNPDLVSAYQQDPRWWKYPGNYHERGRDWERQASLEFFLGDGVPLLATEVGLRINGNNTRGFPQHALRVVMREPVPLDLPEGGGGGGHRVLVLRAAGNDQGDAFCRDLLQHRLCRDLPFATLAGRPVEVRVNGVYWGVHHLRERVDEHELARRHGLDPEGITIIEDRALLYRGDRDGPDVFIDALYRLARMDAESVGFVDSVRAVIDLDGFLAYMAAQCILANTDWPDQNVKWWRYGAGDRDVTGPRDGRWRFIMGDSDMGFGYASDADVDMFAHVLARQGPVASLYRTLMRSKALQARMRAEVGSLLDGPLSTGTMLAAIDRLERELAPAMPAQVKRWRRPADLHAWRAAFRRLRTFAGQRPGSVREQLDRHFTPLPSSLHTAR